jgi:hypothetical protein
MRRPRDGVADQEETVCDSLEAKTPSGPPETEAQSPWMMSRRRALGTLGLSATVLAAADLLGHESTAQAASTAGL